MNTKDALILSGAKGGGGSSSFRNRPDNLRSTDSYEMIVGLGAGRIRLAPGGLKNLFVNNVPVEDSNGKSTFKDFAAILFDGDPTELIPIIPRLGSSSGLTTINVELANQNSSGPGDWVFGAVTTPGVDFIDLRFVVSALYKQDKKGIGNETATIEVQLRPSGSANWINPLSDLSAPAYNQDGIRGSGSKGGLWFYALIAAWGGDQLTWRDDAPGYLRITGKTSSTYVKELRVAVPSEGNYANKTWEVRCRLVEKDLVVSGSDGENESRRTITWESIGGVSKDPIGGTEAWRGISYAQIFGKATDQISGLPEMSSICDLNDYLVPPDTVWDPVTRVYTGAAWDGATTQLRWTPDPAWQIKGVIEDELSGISALVPGSTLNKWDALEASKWFSEQVPDGKGGTHCRYSLHWFMENPLQVHELVNYLAGAVGSTAWDEGDGKWRLKVEKPETPQMIFTKENIVGEFVYSHTDVDSRFNDWTGVFRNSELRYKEDRIRTFDGTDIGNNGRRPTTIALVGCDNRQEALRRLELRKLTALNETRMVTFTTNRQGALLEPLSVIAVADGDLNTDTALRTTGRITSIDGTHIQVRDTMRIEIGVDYKIKLTVPNPDYDPDTVDEPASEEWRKPTIEIERSITNTNLQRGDVRDLYLDTALPENTPEFAVVALEAVGLPAIPKQYRVLGLQGNEDGELVTITALEIYTQKWDLSDNVSEDVINAQTIDRTVSPPEAPDDGVWQLNTFVSEQGERNVLVASWVRPASTFFDHYRLEYRHNGGPWQQLGTTQDTFYELAQPAPGTHEIQIYAVDRRGAESEALAAVFDTEDPAPVRPGNGPNELYDDTFLQSVWNIPIVAGRGFRNAINGFLAGTADYHLDWTIQAVDTGEANSLPRPITVTPNKRYYFVAWVQKNAAASDTTCTIGIRFLDDTGTVVGDFPTSFNSSAIPAGAAPKPVFAGGIAPSDAVEAYVYIIVDPVAGADGNIRFERPALTNLEPGADVTSVVEGPGDASFKYSSTGVAEAGEFPRDLLFTLRNALGPVSEGVTWEYVVTDGSVNTNAADPDTSIAMGSSLLTISSLESETAEVLVRGTLGGIVRTKTVTLKREYLPPPSSGGSTGGGGTAGSNQTSGFNNISGTTPVAVSNSLQIDVTGTTATVNVNLTVRPVSAFSEGEWTVNLKVQRETAPGSGTWVDVGAVAQGFTAINLRIIEVEDGETQEWYKPVGATVTFSRQATGLSAGPANFRVVGYLSSGTQEHTVTGTVGTVVP